MDGLLYGMQYQAKRHMPSNWRVLGSWQQHSHRLELQWPVVDWIMSVRFSISALHLTRRVTCLFPAHWWAIRAISHVVAMCLIMKPIFSPALETKHAFCGMLKPTSAYRLLEETLHLDIMETSWGEYLLALSYPQSARWLHTMWEELGNCLGFSNPFHRMAPKWLAGTFLSAKVFSWNSPLQNKKLSCSRAERYQYSEPQFLLLCLLLLI